MPVLPTIGYGNMTPEDFKSKLLIANVDWIIDVRAEEKARISTYRPGLPLGGFLQPKFGYMWFRQLGNPFIPKKGASLEERHKEILKYRDWLLCGDGQEAFLDFQKRLLFITKSKVCLLCCEGKPIIDGLYNCHRAVLAEELCKILNRQISDLKCLLPWEVWHI